MIINSHRSNKHNNGSSSSSMLMCLFNRGRQTAAKHGSRGKTVRIVMLSHTTQASRQAGITIIIINILLLPPPPLLLLLIIIIIHIIIVRGQEAGGRRAGQPASRICNSESAKEHKEDRLGAQTCVPRQRGILVFFRVFTTY